MRKTAAVIGIGFLSTVWLTGCVSDEMIIQANWKMQLPDGGKELYHADTGASFHGDGEKYTVLQYENTEDISKFLNWRADDGTGTLYTNSYSEFAENCLNIIDVPQKERPDYEDLITGKLLWRKRFRQICLHNFGKHGNIEAIRRKREEIEYAGIGNRQFRADCDCCGCRRHSDCCRIYDQL